MNRSRRRLAGALTAALVVLAATLSANASGPRLLVYRAATLSSSFDQLAGKLSAWNIEQESGGSTMLLRKLQGLRPPVDVLAVADASLFANPKPPLPPWWIGFANGELVLAYTPQSRFAQQINASNWADILLRPGVRSAYANPNMDPEGYNTLLAWQLAERYYHRPGLAQELRQASGKRYMRAHSVALLALLESGQIDYAWQYLAVAKQHGLRYVRLPKQINLSDPRLASWYRQASIQVAGARPGTRTTIHASPILYAITIPQTSTNHAGAVGFILKLLSPAGAAILRANSQQPLAPPFIQGSGAPARLVQAVQALRKRSKQAIR